MNAAWLAVLKTVGTAIVSFLVVWFPAHIGILPIDPKYQALIAGLLTALAHNLPSPALAAKAANASSTVISTSGR
jgi:hypothetical protein